MEPQEVFTTLREGYLEAASAAIRANPEFLKQKDGAGIYLAHLAAAAGILGEVRGQMSRDVLELTDERGWTVAHYAAARGNLRDLAEIFQQHPYLLEWEDWAQETPVHVAARTASLQQVDWKRHYSTLSHPNHLLESPAHIAARAGDFGSIAALVTPELLMLRDISGTTVLDEISRNPAFKEIVPALVFAEAWRRLGRWSPEEMMLWTFGRAAEPRHSGVVTQNRIGHLLEVALRIRQIEDVLLLERIMGMDTQGSIEDLQKQARELAAKKNSIQEVNSAQELLRSAECGIPALPVPGRRVTSKLKAAARHALKQLARAASNEDVKLLGEAVSSVVGALGNLRARQREAFCEHFFKRACFTDPASAAKFAGQEVKKELCAECPSEWLALPVACLDRARREDVERHRRQHEEIIRRHYFQLRDAGKSPAQAFPLAEDQLRSGSGCDWATSPVSGETLEDDYANAGPQSPASSPDLETGKERPVTAEPSGFIPVGSVKNWDEEYLWQKAVMEDGGEETLTYGIRHVHVAAAYRCLEAVSPELLAEPASSNDGIFLHAMRAIGRLLGADSCACIFYKQLCPEEKPADTTTPHKHPSGDLLDVSFAWEALRNPEGQTAQSIFDYLERIQSRAADLDAASGLGPAGEPAGELASSLTSPLPQATKGGPPEPGISVVCHWFLPVISEAIWSCRKGIRRLNSDDVWDAALGSYKKKLDSYRPDSGINFPAFAWRRLRGSVFDCWRQKGPLSGNLNRRKYLIIRAQEDLHDRFKRDPTILELAKELRDELSLSEDDRHAVMELRKIRATCGLNTVTGTPETEEWESAAAFEGKIMSVPNILDQQQREYSQLSEDFRDDFKSLSPRDRTIFLLHLLGQTGDKSITTKALARMMGWQDAAIISRKAKLVKEKLIRQNGRDGQSDACQQNDHEAIPKSR